MRLCLGERPAAEGAGAEEGCGVVDVVGSALRLLPATWDRSERLMGVLAGVTLRAKRGALDKVEQSKSNVLAFLDDSEKNWRGSMFSVSGSSKSAGA